MNTLKQSIANCIAGNHNLVVMERFSISSMEDCVVRWCTECGSIVVDQEADGRLMGHYQRMRSPAITKKVTLLK
jgi:hypothetical protein